ncbi:MAG: agmatine deiminase family protein [Hyphomonas oceanitis]|uniref:agmatine deiminase family protein n=1 Tax=Hyphomonas oceanitis TaxID=81033 RepID=UPI0030033E7B
MPATMTEAAFSLPPEWAPQAALWCGWPRLAEEWGGNYDGARAEIAALIRAAAAFVPVKVAAGSEEAARSAQAAVGDVAQIVEVPTGDVWLRDTGPIITRGAGGFQAETFRFNGWGGKYLMPGDTETAAAIAGVEGVSVRAHDTVLEGGAIDVDGEGRLLTTRQCLLNPNRNGAWTEADAEAALVEAFGVNEVIWLGDGLLNDHTDGHVDNIARFIAPGHVLCQHPTGEQDPNADVLLAIEDKLRTAGLMVSTISSPGPVDFGDGEPVPASHMNFTITNGAVFVPTYDERFSLVALAELRPLFPGRKVIGLPALNILRGGGSFHCMTREIPAQ